MEGKTKEQKMAAYLMEWLKNHNYKVTGRYDMFVNGEDVTVWGEYKNQFNLFLIDRKHHIYQWFGMEKGWKKMIDEKVIEMNQFPKDYSINDAINAADENETWG